MKLPLTHTLGNRQASLDKDALMRNALADVEQEGRILRSRKRPSIVGAYTAATGTGQALFVWNIPGALGPTQQLVTITNNTINTAPSPVIGQFNFSVQPS